MFGLFKKEKPLLGLTGLGGGAGGYLVGGAGGVGSFTIKKYDTSNSLQSTTPYSNIAPGTTYTYADAGYYTLEIEASSDDIQFQMWAWGGAGGTGSDSHSPGAGGAGGGVRGTSTFSGGDTITFLVGGGGIYRAVPTAYSGSFPDGGNADPKPIGPQSYIEGPGGGRSSIYDGVLPFANRDATPNTFLLIGGGGGGGSTYCTSGTFGGQGGYPAGTRGGGYYPADTQVDGYGGDQSSGGAGGSGGRAPGSTAGSKHAGGPGYGGGGAGGYYGGGGASGYYAMGGGGSGYIDPSLANTASFTASPGPTNHRVAVDDPANPGIKPTPAGTSSTGPSTPNGGEDGAVIFKVLNVS